MAIYKPPKPRWPLALASLVAGLLVGGLVGFALGSREPDPALVAQDLRTKLIEASAPLDVAAIEYEEAVEDGEVLREAEYEGSVDAVALSRSRYEELRPALEVLGGDLVDELDVAFDEVERRMEERAEQAEVEDALLKVDELLKGDEGA